MLEPHVRNRRFSPSGTVLLLTGSERRCALVRTLLCSCNFELRPKDLQDVTGPNLRRHVACLADHASCKQDDFGRLLRLASEDGCPVAPVLSLVSEECFEAGREALWRGTADVLVWEHLNKRRLRAALRGAARRALSATGMPVGGGLRSLFEQCQAPQLLADPTTGYIVDANAAACAFYGYAPAELIQIRLARLRVCSQIEEGQRGEQSAFYFRHRTASGEERVVKVYLNLISFPGGPLLHVLIQDVTSRIEAQRKLEELALVDSNPEAGPLARKQLAEHVLERFRDTLQIPPETPYQVRSVLACIHRHLFDSELSVSWVLEQCEVSSHTFYRKFKQCQGKTIRQYYETKRMEAARRLLRHEELDLTGIALSLGYSSYGTFGRACKRVMACSPSAFREKLGENAG